MGPMTTPWPIASRSDTQGLPGTRLITCEADKSIKVYKEDSESTEERDPVDWKPTIIRKSRF